MIEHRWRTVTENVKGTESLLSSRYILFLCTQNDGKKFFSYQIMLGEAIGCNEEKKLFINNL